MKASAPPQSVKGSLEWVRALEFRGTAGGGRAAVLDGNRRIGCSPTETLLLALAGCMAIDVAVVLEKRRAALDSLRVEIEGERAGEAPRRFTRIALRFEVAGRGFTARHVERALELSREKYCSVWHSLRRDIELVITHNVSGKSS